MTADVRRRLARRSAFACSICGGIPIVFHHIEGWAKTFSNDEASVLTVCDRCHRRVHGRGGTVFSKQELYQYKASPKKPRILRDTLPLGAKRRYSVFVGSNFISDGGKISLFSLPGGHSLVSIDTSSGMLRLSVLAGLDENGPIYLIKENELLLRAEDVWDMEYSGACLKIWRIIDGARTVFIDLALEPEIIIIRRMNSHFNGRLFRVRKLRAPRRRALDSVASRVAEYERLFERLAAEIDGRPAVYGLHNGVDIDAVVREGRKQIVKMHLERDLKDGLRREFNWDWAYSLWVLGRVLERSPVFGEASRERVNLPPAVLALHERVAEIKAKHRRHFEALEDVVAEYGGMIYLGNVALDSARWDKDGAA